MGAPAHVIAEWARHCHCCPVCSVKPCDGVMAGGICDSLECVCDGAIDFDGEGPSDASPLTDDLDDATIHEPVTKEINMSEAHASERADLVAKPYAWLFEPHPIRLFFEAPRDPRGWLALYTEDALRAELSRASATAQPAGKITITTDETGRCVAVTRQDEDHKILSVLWEAQEPADTKAVMEEFHELLSTLCKGVWRDVERGRISESRETQQNVDALRSFAEQHLASRASPSQEPADSIWNAAVEACAKACAAEKLQDPQDDSDYGYDTACIDCEKAVRRLQRKDAPKPAATASRTVSAAKIDPDRFIREAADKAAVWSYDCRNIRVLPMSALDTILITLAAMQNHSKPCEDGPDCTPASAEQVKCVCGFDSTKYLCRKLFTPNPREPSCCGNDVGGIRCGHPRACHAAAEGRS